MRGRAWSTLLVMFVGVALAAALQENCPPLGAVRVKPPLLLGVAVYYAMRREAVWGVVAAVWCGALENGLGPVPGGVPLADYFTGKRSFAPIGTYEACRWCVNNDNYRATAERVPTA